MSILQDYYDKAVIGLKLFHEHNLEMRINFYEFLGIVCVAEVISSIFR